MEGSRLKPTQKWNYSVKLINPIRKSLFSIQKLRITSQFQSIEELKNVLETHLASAKKPVTSVGYVEPGHGAKGKQRWIINNEDLEDMYKIHEGKSEILMWCYEQTESDSSKSSKSVGPPAKVQKITNHSKHQEQMDEVDFIFQELQEKQTDSLYSPEQLRTWAHLIYLKKHKSYEVPPDKPFFKVSQEKMQNSKETNDLLSSTGISPGKRLNLRSQCIEQLSQWYNLLEKGAITKEQYDKMQSSIMDDLKKF